MVVDALSTLFGIPMIVLLTHREIELILERYSLYKNWIQLWRKKRR